MKQTETYKVDEIVLIITACNTLPELEKVYKQLAYLYSRGLQKMHPAVSKVGDIQERRIMKNLNYGRNN